MKCCHAASFCAAICFLFGTCLSPTLAETSEKSLDDWLQSGELSQGEQRFARRLRVTPSDEESRLALGIIQVFRSFERASQRLHSYGAKSTALLGAVGRWPIKENSDPAAISFAEARTLSEMMLLDFARIESNLAVIARDDVAVSFRLLKVKVDVDGDGKPTDELGPMLSAMSAGRLVGPAKNPDLLVRFDRGDVAWLRSYCHLLMAFAEASLVESSPARFESSASYFFPKVRMTMDPAEVAKAKQDRILIAEPERFARIRLHLLSVCQLNRESWRFIRAEPDDEFEWLPSAKQKNGAMGLPVRDEMVDRWLEGLSEIELLLEGKRVVPPIFLGKGETRGIDVQKLLDDAPPYFDLTDGVDEKYLAEKPIADILKLVRAFEAFDGSMRFGYLAWFN